MTNTFSKLAISVFTLFASACSTPTTENTADGNEAVDRRSAAIDQIIPKGAALEILGEGYSWPEGPVWLDAQQALHFNDVPENKMYRWTAETGVQLFLTPSGGGSDEMAARMREPGANGIINWPTSENEILLADHGARGLSILNLQSFERDTIISSYDGKSLNSPNDMQMRSDGAVFFTDPPYGLKDLNASPDKELSFNGVYLYQDDEPLKLVIDDLSFPNGIGLSPDEATLYVAVSDPENPVIMAYDTAADGSVSNGRVFFNAAPELKDGSGLPDGMDIAKNGIVFATGPDGVYVLSPDGEVLGVVSTGMPVSNCTLDDAEEYLYMTSSSVLARIPVNLD